ncbi:MAG: SWIM zinc finger family protein [Verrucomicrobiota bacterium]
MSWYSFRPYVSVAERRAKAANEAAKMAKKGIRLSPIEIKGRTIAATFWGKAWCKHVESFSDYSNRLPRGRTYARNGSVIDLQIEPQKITAQVMGSSLYKQTITVAPIDETRWKTIKETCSGRIDSLVELLQGRLSDAVMTVITDRDRGLFPHPSEIKMDCSCPDWAGLCKHLAAVFYGIGARLDHQPELLFTLRRADHSELITEAVSAKAIPDTGAATLDSASLADVFGIDIDTTREPDAPQPTPKSTPKTVIKTKRLTKNQREQIDQALKPAKKRTAGSRKSPKPAATIAKPINKPAKPRKKAVAKNGPAAGKPAVKSRTKRKLPSPSRRRKA